MFHSYVRLKVACYLLTYIFNLHILSRFLNIINTKHDFHLHFFWYSIFVPAFFIFYFPTTYFLQLFSNILHYYILEVSLEIIMYLYFVLLLQSLLYYCLLFDNNEILSFHIYHVFYFYI